MTEAADIRESETVATAKAKGHSDQRFVRPIYAGSSGEDGMRVARALESCLDRKALAGSGGPMSPIR